MSQLLSTAQQMNIPSIPIDNAPWWEDGSSVSIKEDYLAEDEAYVNNGMMKVVGLESGKPEMQNNSGSQGILKVERMVIQGTVRVKRGDAKRGTERIKTVLLPQDARLLMARDLNYIVKQIDAYNPPMTAEEQESFLPSASEPDAAH